MDRLGVLGRQLGVSSTAAKEEESGVDRSRQLRFFLRYFGMFLGCFFQGVPKVLIFKPFSLRTSDDFVLYPFNGLLL